MPVDGLVECVHLRRRTALELQQHTVQALSLLNVLAAPVPGGQLPSRVVGVDTKWSSHGRLEADQTPYLVDEDSAVIDRSASE